MMFSFKNQSSDKRYHLLSIFSISLNWLAHTWGKKHITHILILYESLRVSKGIEKGIKRFNRPTECYQPLSPINFYVIFQFLAHSLMISFCASGKRRLLNYDRRQQKKSIFSKRRMKKICKSELEIGQGRGKKGMKNYYF